LARKPGGPKREMCWFRQANTQQVVEADKMIHMRMGDKYMCYFAYLLWRQTL